MRMTAKAVCLALSIFACAASFFADGANVACYVCMGRDQESCMRGKTACDGYCYKVVDTGHDLVSKGCSAVTIENPLKPEKEEWSPEPHITLYWTNADNRTKPRDYVRGHTYFCKDDMCNAAPQLVSANSYAFMASLAIIAFLWR